MGKKDYTKFSNNRRNANVEESQNGFVEAPVVEEAVAEEVVEEKVVESKRGVVANCFKLNVRSEPNPDSDVVCVIDPSTDLVIDDAASTEEFYKVCTASGAEGFCMKMFIRILP